MAKNFIQSGNVATVASPRKVQSGEGVLVGRLFGVASSAAEYNAPVEVALTGVFSLPKEESAVEQGMPLYWDNTARQLTLTEQGNYAVGVAIQYAGKNDLSVTIRLFGLTL